MKKLASIALSLFIVFLFAESAFSQGCVAVRNFSCVAHMPGDSLTEKPWQLTFGYRYLKSDRHFRGFEEEPERQEEHTEVINNVNSIDVALTYAISSRWSVGFTLPLTHARRSSLYEHDRENRFTTTAYGIGDVRLTGYYRVLNPNNIMKRDLIVGLGVKAPTGEDGFRDVFYRPDGPYERPVDQSIQPGDGGWGANVELQFYMSVYKNLGMYANGFYLFNPMETNDVDRTGNGGARDYDRYFSVPDQFLGRLGLYYMIPKAGLTFNVGGRMEGVPVEDVFGGDLGYRRPGYTFSIEPGVTYQKGIHSFELNVPAAVIRNRPQSVADKIREEQTGEPRNGDAAFADYLVLITYSFKFGKSRETL